MERRAALKSMAMSAAGLLVLPAWANGWNKTSVVIDQPVLSGRQQAVLAEVVDTLIPASDTPGAKELRVQDFIQKMIEDCYEADVQKKVALGLDSLDTMARQTYGKDYAACEPAQRRELLLKVQALEDKEQKEYYNLLKQLTIQGYTTSEYVMVNHYKYTMMPGHYYGCVPVSQ
ncbi:gluconate 2-dehydrogenase subunit 3 family protein [Telluribacter sp. SYSU D00476]|uniref:gluconate 2-dehydrogenase subunit 3 family protein n=1 Tax=Telluribacter sp. SYSU D00476 TaxID=2811430 RepID=UPI001FF57B55|nr:gluconate 2-dehydrogenase subunit 3 family protein [Telluribacter sp. SYSU D00476]